MDCELLIIGGGAAGQTAALSALEHGIKDIIIVEKSDKIGGNICKKIDLCTSDKNLVSILKELDIGPNHVSNQSKWYSPSEIEFDFKSRISDLWFKRGSTTDSFDVRIANIVNKKGGKILLNHEATKIEVEKDLVRVKLKYKNETKELKSKTIISSEGLNSIFIKKRDYFPILSSGFYGKQFDMDEGVPYIFFDNQKAYGSYVFILKDPNDGVGYIINGYLQKKDKTDPETKITEITKNNNIIKNILKNVERQGNIRGTLFAAKPLPKIGYNKVLLTGDSAGLMDSLLHYGLKQAIISGYYSSKIMSNFLQEDNRYIKEYNNFYFHNFKQKLDVAYFYRKIFNKINNQDIDILFKMLNDFKKYDVNFDDLFDYPKKHLKTIFKIIIQNPSCLRLIPKIMTAVY